MSLYVSCMVPYLTIVTHLWAVCPCLIYVLVWNSWPDGIIAVPMVLILDDSSEYVARSCKKTVLFENIFKFSTAVTLNKLLKQF